jgi:beta-N-acetylhexosaminidase
MARRSAFAIIAIAVLLSGCAASPITLDGPLKPWTTVPAVAVDPVVAYSTARLADLTLEQKIASLLMIHAPGTNAANIRGTIDATGVAGVIFMGDNVPGSAAGLAAMTAVLSSDPGLPVLTSIDQEGGIVRRLPGDSAASASQLRSQDPAAAEAAFRARSALVASAGVSINFGIVADVTADHHSFIYPRVMGLDAASAAPRVAAAVAGEKGTVFSTLKHFPGHGSVEGDSHVSVPTTGMGIDEWRATQAPPFQAGIDAGAEFVMMGHLRYSSIDTMPATLSPVWNKILRDDLGFTGIIVTDDMTMLEHSGEAQFSNQAQNATWAIAAGDTLLLYVGPVDVGSVVATVASAVRTGSIPESTIDDAALRLLELRRGMSTETGPYIHCGDACRAITS